MSARLVAATPALRGKAVMLRDPARAEKLRIAVRYLLDKQRLRRGHQTRLAEHFGITRQRVNQIVDEERARVAIRSLLQRKALDRPYQSRVAMLYGISLQQVDRLVEEELMELYGSPSARAGSLGREPGRESAIQAIR